MEACLAVEREQEKVVKKLRTLSGTASERLQKIIDQVNTLREQLNAGLFHLKPTITLLYVSEYQF